MPAHSITIERVLTDNGSRYRSQLFDTALPDGARHRFPALTRPMGRSSTTTGSWARSSPTPDPEPQKSGTPSTRNAG